MKSRYIKTFGVGLSLALAVNISGCTDLDETLYSKVASENHEFTDAENAASLADVYNKVIDEYWGWFGLVDIMEEASDVWGVPNRIGIGWGDLYVSMHKHEFNSEIGHFQVNWDQNYAGINACNKALANDAVNSSKSVSAIIRSMRALYYYNLLDLYRNIPLDTVFVHEDGWTPEQSDPKKTFEFIESELLAVVDDLPTAVSMSSFNQYAGHMLLAKLYLNRNAWFYDDPDDIYYEKCLQQLDKVIEGPFSLSNDYSDNFQEDISSSKEIIYGITLENKYKGGNFMANLWCHEAGRATYEFSGWATGGGIVFPQFLNIYEPNDNRLKKCWNWGKQYKANGEEILVDGEPLIYDTTLHSINDPGCYPFESARLIKYEIVAGDFGTSYDDIPYFRLADAYLMKAECLLRLGKNEEEAAELVTAVRRRNFDNPEDAIVTVDQLKGGSKYAYGHHENKGKQGEADDWVITKEGGDDIELGGLLDELAREFVCEAHRRDDLIRFRIKGTDMNVFNGKSWFCKDAVADRHCDLFPIPKSALDGNIKLKQNPGY